MNKKIYQSLYDYVSNEYTQLTKEELKNIILEVLFAVYSDKNITLKHYKKMITEALAELTETHDSEIYLQIADA